MRLFVSTSRRTEKCAGKHSEKIPEKEAKKHLTFLLIHDIKLTKVLNPGEPKIAPEK
jgi:hypothetical protein